MFDDIFHTLITGSEAVADPLTFDQSHHGYEDLWHRPGLGHIGGVLEDMTGVQHTHSIGDVFHHAPPAHPDMQPAYETTHGHFTPITQDPAVHHHAAEVGDLGGQAIPYHTYWNPADFHGVGHPLEYSQYWQHQTGEDCAVMAQGEIFASLTGYHLTEQQLCQLAQEHGLYDPETGTRPQDVGKLLNLLGVQTEQEHNASFYELANALEHNDRVIVGLNANDIWHPARDSVTGAPVEQPMAGHAVWVTGIDQAPDGSIKVILCDSGTPNGQLEAVDVHDFLNAWADYGNEMVVAHQPA